jgi:hypothetical protein
MYIPGLGLPLMVGLHSVGLTANTRVCPGCGPAVAAALLAPTHGASPSALDAGLALSQLAIRTPVGTSGLLRYCEMAFNVYSVYSICMVDWSPQKYWLAVGGRCIACRRRLTIEDVVPSSLPATGPLRNAFETYDRRCCCLIVYFVSHYTFLFLILYFVSLCVLFNIIYFV